MYTLQHEREVQRLVELHKDEMHQLRTEQVSADLQAQVSKWREEASQAQQQLEITENVSDPTLGWKVCLVFFIILSLDPAVFRNGINSTSVL